MERLHVRGVRPQADSRPTQDPPWLGPGSMLDRPPVDPRSIPDRRPNMTHDPSRIDPDSTPGRHASISQRCLVLSGISSTLRKRGLATSVHASGRSWSS